MNDVDIVAQAARIRDHRFTGYTNAMLADEIELMRSGQGVTGLSEAVAALRAVARALEETDDTLRAQLAKLGVEWESDGGREATSAVRGEADFSREAGEKVNASAERIFAQGEAFNRTVHSLPDPAVLRTPVPEPGIAEFAFSLLGFESDHVRRLHETLEAREQAVQALDAYARQSGENLLGAPELGPPDRLVAKVSQRVPESINAGGGPGDTTSPASTSAGPPAPGPTTSAPSSSAPAPSPVPTGAVTPSAVSTPVFEAPSYGKVTGSTNQAAPSSGGAAPSGQGGASGQGGTIPPATGNAVPPAAAGGAAGPVGKNGGVDSVRTRQGMGQPVSGSPGGRDSEVTSRSAKPTTSGGGTTGTTPHGSGGLGGKSVQSAPHAQLARGMGSGSVASTPSAAPDGNLGEVPPSVGEGLSVNDLGGGIAALGAGGVAGALSSTERTGRGVGRSAPGAKISPRPLAIGDLPEEEAKVQRSSERLNPGGATRRETFLEKAVPGADEEGEHVRRFGVEDDDLFTDERMVSPNVLGDDDSDGRL